uniref:Nucleolar protein 9 n=1 Tax=Psilocybe cubensis TaxID=181762 RepID=A0A8H7Y237_PSICU
MPRENRKRGKKHKKQNEDESKYNQESAPQLETREEPSWIVPAQDNFGEFNPEAPFGYVDADVKAYFRTVDIQIRDWQESQHDTGEGDGDLDPNEQRRLFFIAALSEMRGKEKQLATDPDCSVIIERMSYSMDDFVRRVFVDTLSGSYEILLKHRFASHVCQTLFTVAKDTISREMRGIMPTVPDSEEEGELRTLKQLILDICEELLPSFHTLIMDPFASHVVRSLLLLLSPNLSTSDESSQSAVRSKKSAAWKARQGQMKSVFSDGQGKGKETIRSAPAEFRQMARRFVETVREHLDDNETRAMAASKVACPGLQMLLEVEADQDLANQPGSLMDRVMVGVITACKNDSTADIEESDYLGTLLRDVNSSHLLETIVSRCPDDAFNALWKTYFKGKLARLAAHPVANFVLAKALERVSESQLTTIFEELDATWNKLIRTSRTGVLRALIDRVSLLGSSNQPISEIVYSAFNITTSEEKALLVPCVLTLLPLPDYHIAHAEKTKTEETSHQHHHKSRTVQDPLEPKIQGSVLMQSILRLPEGHNQFAIDGIRELSIDDRIKIAHNSSGSRVFDALLESPTVTPKMKRQFVIDFIGHYHKLVDDKLGSRVGDRCWSYSDTYLKEKIARSLVSQEQALAASFYGKFFARNLNLYLLQRRPDDWRNLQSERKKQEEQEKKITVGPTVMPPKTTQPDLAEEAVTPAKPFESRKRKSRPENEIDALFNEKLGKRVKKGALGDAIALAPSPEKLKKDVKDEKNLGEDKELQQVLGAIRLAPGNDKKHKKRK